MRRVLALVRLSRSGSTEHGLIPAREARSAEDVFFKTREKGRRILQIVAFKKALLVLNSEP